jgi:hypothetical protein
MSTVYSEVKAHRDAITAAEGVRQTAVAAAATQKAVIVAELAFARACYASAIANGCSPYQWTTMLKELGVQT